MAPELSVKMKRATAGSQAPRRGSRPRVRSGRLPGLDQHAAGGLPIVGVEPEQALHDRGEHRPAGLDGCGVEGLRWGKGDDHVAGGTAQRRL
jgi:hypothetical protein